MSIIMTVDRGYAGFLFLILFSVFMVVSWTYFRHKDWRFIDQIKLREIPAYENLKRGIDISVELGQRLHLSLGWAPVTTQYSPSGLIGLSLLKHIVHITAHGDKAPITTSGEGSLLILAQDTAHRAFQESHAQEKDEYFSHQLSGVEPIPYAAGSLSKIYKNELSATILAGHFGIEAALITDASEKQNTLTVAGSDELTAQSVMIGTCDNPLIGEELFACGAYLQINSMHTASILTQDVFRWILIIIMLVGCMLKFIGII